jgi:arylsulfatase A-like enzyme
MKAIVIMFDSLNRHTLPPYGCEWVHAPNFGRLVDRCVTFDKPMFAACPSCLPDAQDPIQSQMGDSPIRHATL